MSRGVLQEAKMQNELTGRKTRNPKQARNRKSKIRPRSGIADCKECSCRELCSQAGLTSENLCYQDYLSCHSFIFSAEWLSGRIASQSCAPMRKLVGVYVI